jgi:hypothetical protein
LVIPISPLQATSYRNPDATPQRRGCELLNASGTAVVISRNTLTLGHEYRDSARTSQGNFECEFGLKLATTVETAQRERADAKQVAATLK